MKLILLTCLLVASLAQEKGSSRQHKAWKFTEDSKKENSSSPKESVREERTSDLLRPSEDESSREPKILDARTSTNNRSSEEIEGRFFLKDKLCLLGLADCRQKNAYYSGGAGVNLGGIQYVQPIKVVPHGQPIAAVPIANPHNSGPTHSNYQVSSHQAHHKPTYGAPKPTYDAPQPIYGAPKPTYNSPKPTYDAPKPTYGAPEPTYDAPKPTYGAPKPTYNSPKPTYGAPKPTYGAPKPIYKAPKPTYGAPSSYGAPSYNAPSSSYGSQDSYGINNRYEGQLTGNIYSHPYQTNFESTAVKRDDGVTHGHHGSQHHGGSSHGHHNSNAHHQSGAHHGLQTSHNSAHQNGIHSSESHSTHGHKGDHRQGRLEDDCYCVPLNQCPSHEIVTSGSSSRFTNGDASTHFTNGGGSSQFTNGGASNQFINGATSSQFTNGGFSSQFTNGGASSQFTNGGASSQFTNGGTSSQFTNGGASSQFSSGAAKQFPNSQKKDYSHLINPRNKKTDIEAEEDEGAVEKKEIVESKKKVEKEEALSPRNARSGKSLEVEKPVMNITKEETISKNDNKESESRKKRDIEEPQDFITGEEDVLPRQRIPFGPNGVKPPTCGFPNSGYVCCRVAPSQGGLTQFVGSSVNTGSSSNFNQLSNQKNNRAVSSQSSGFTSFSNNINSGFPSPGQCGKRNAQGINGRITGTQFERKSGETEFGEYPWQVAILKKDEFDNVYLCAGSLIDGSHVITAAHCIRGYNPDEIVLRLGEWDVNNDSEFYTHIELDAKNLFIHEEFYPGNLYNDIAVIRMTEYVDFSRNRHISPVCLPDSFHNFAGQRCFVTGWGKDAFLDGNYQHILKEVNLPVVDNSRCENLLRRTKLGRDFTLDKGFLCAGGEEGKDACKGDGGGPLVCSVNGLWQLAGIVSWGIGCGEQNIPGVYIKVSEYENWIQKQLLRTL
uniref:Putative LOC100164097 [Acyrthosiphon pisum] n=1 Tax=Lepeophtheirus salmonis TaxID=72036 RepID=A0A0K2SZK0_LEPSM